MVHKMKKLRLALLIVITVAMCLFAVFEKGNTETNILKTLVPQNVFNMTEFVPITNKSAAVVKVVFESDSRENVEKLRDNFIAQTDKNYFENKSLNISKLMNQYLTHPTNFLSNHTRYMLKSEKYDEVFEKSMESLYSPTGLQLTSMDRDPYLLFDDFIISNKRISRGASNINGRYYDYLMLMIKTGDGLSPDVSNKEIKKLIKIKKALSTDNSTIYLAGAPIHSYYASRKSVVDINLICILSILMIGFLTHFYFKNVKMLLPVAMSTFLGILSGYVATKIWFTDFQIITMVFSTTLIGIGIDYSYHYFFGGSGDIKDKNFVKNLSLSFLTTIVPFVLLYLTKIELLRQISVFTVFGLLAIYLTVLFIYPCFEFPTPQRKINFSFKYYKMAFVALCILSVIGLTRLYFNDSMTALYNPSPRLKKAERLYTKISGDNYHDTQFIVVKGDSIEDILAKEEKITDELTADNIEYLSLSKFFPSAARQRENFRLVKDLYKHTLFKYSNLLSVEQMRRLKGQGFTPVIFNVKEYPVLSDFMLDDNTSVIYIFSGQRVFISDKSAKVVNIKGDIAKYMLRYRVLLLELLPIVGIILLIMLARIYGKQQAVRILAPSAYGMLGGLGMTGLVFGELNLFSIITLFLLLGFTIDYSIFRNSGGEKTEDAIFASSLTTSFAFLLLSLSGFKLLSSMAAILFFGIIIAYLSGFVIFTDNGGQKAE